MAELDACPMHQRGTCTSAPVIYKALPHTCTALALQLVQHQHSNKRLTITPSYNQIAITFICIRFAVLVLLVNCAKCVSLITVRSFAMKMQQGI